MAQQTSSTNRPILLTQDIIAAFDSFTCSDPTHRTGLTGSSAVKVANCTSAKKYAIVNEYGDFYIAHDDTISGYISLGMWKRAGAAPVDMSMLVSDDERYAKRKMLQLKAIAKVETRTSEKQSQAKPGTKVSKKVVKDKKDLLKIEEHSKTMPTHDQENKTASNTNDCGEDVVSEGDLDWEIVDGEDVDGDYVLLN